MLKAIVDGAPISLALHDVVDQQRADLVAGNAVDIEQLDRFLPRSQRREIDREAAADDAIGLKQHEIDFE